MGLNFIGTSRDSYGESYPIIQNPNPDPNNWMILKDKKIGNFLVVMIQYPDCHNYEGKKILVYENITLPKLRQQTKIDPHFCENKNYKSPIARFEPTDRGWNMAALFCDAIGKMND
jgi:hypothetical protein